MRPTEVTLGRHEPLVRQRRSRDEDGVAALTTVGVVAAVLNTHGSLQQLAATALARMRSSLGLEVLAMHLVGHGRDAPGHPPTLVEFATNVEVDAAIRVREELSSNVITWSLLAAARGPIVFGDAADLLIANPFDPPATSWFVLPLHAEGDLVGTVVGASTRPIALDAAGVIVLTTLGNMLSTGIATARMRVEQQRMAVEQERLRLIADLHDGLAQDLAVARREIAVMADGWSAATAHPGWARLREAVDDAHHAVRAGLEDRSAVMPLGGLVIAIEDLCRRFGDRGLAVTTQLEDPAPDVPPQVAATVLQILHQGLTNIQQHAQVERAIVGLRSEASALRLSVVDAGRGIGNGGPREGGNRLGIEIMTRRARSVGGSLAVAPGPGCGTIVTLHVPLGRARG